MRLRLIWISVTVFHKAVHEQLWTWSLQFAAEMLLEGIAKAGVRSRCTVMGRSAMSLDLQVSHNYSLSLRFAWLHRSAYDR